MKVQDSKSKEKSVREMFAAIAHSYDSMNRFLSWGRDTHWRREAVRLAEPGKDRVLDVATGTGDIALELVGYADLVVGVDSCPEMLNVGLLKASRRKLGRRIEFIAGDALALPFVDNSFDCALNGFALRNVSDLSLFFSELRRVIKPGGRVVCLEFTKPSPGVFGALYRFYLFGIIPVLGRWVSGNTKAYEYLPASISCFMNEADLQKLMEDAGFRNVSYKSLNLGTVAIHVGIK